MLFACEAKKGTASLNGTFSGFQPKIVSNICKCIARLQMSELSLLTRKIKVYNLNYLAKFLTDYTAFEVIFASEYYAKIEFPFFPFILLQIFAEIFVSR